MPPKNKFISLKRAARLKTKVKFIRIFNDDSLRLLEKFEEIRGIEIVGNAVFTAYFLDKYAYLLEQITVLKTSRGYFPEAAFNFHNLEELYLWNQPSTRAEDEDQKDNFSQIPNRFHLLPQLKVLKGIWLGAEHQFPESLFTCKRLTELVIGLEDGANTPSCFHEFPELKQLSITAKGKKDNKTMDKMLLSVARCSKLQYFRLKLADFLPWRKLIIPVSFSQLKQLKTLILNGYYIYIPDNLNIESLEYYEIRSDYEKKLPWNDHSIPKNLHSLVVKGAKSTNSLTEIYANTPKTIRHLALNKCLLENIPPVIYSYPNLNHLDLSFNMIERTSCTLWLLPKLQFINLENNPFPIRKNLKKIFQFAKKLINLNFSKYACLLQVAIMNEETAFYNFYQGETAILLESLNSPQDDIAEKVLEILSKNKANAFNDPSIKQGRIFVQGRIFGYQKEEIQEKLQERGLQITDNVENATHVLLGILPERLPQAVLENKLEFITIEHLKSYLAETSDSYISNKPENETSIANLKRLFSSKDPVNIEMVLSILWEEGIPDVLFYILFEFALRRIGPSPKWALRIIKKHAPIHYTHIIEKLLSDWKIAHLDKLPKEEQREIIKILLAKKTAPMYKHYFQEIKKKAKELGL